MSKMLNVIIINDHAVGMVACDQVFMFTPEVACEVAASLTLAAKNLDPYIDPPAIMAAYIEAHPDEVPRLNSIQDN